MVKLFLTVLSGWSIDVLKEEITEVNSERLIGENDSKFLCLMTHLWDSCEYFFSLLVKICKEIHKVLASLGQKGIIGSREL